MKRAAAFLLAAVLLAAPAYAANVASPTSDFYVNDYAGVLSPATERHIMDVSVPLARETGAQVAVLTVESLEGMSIEDYGLEVGRSWGIGSESDDSGVLLLLSTGDREVRIEVGYGLEGAINDAKAGRLIDNYAVPYYAEDDFDTGTAELYNAIVSVVREEYGLEPLDGYASAGEGFSFTEDLSGQETAILIGVLLVLAVIVISILYSVVMAIARLVLMPFGIKVPRRKNRILELLLLLLWSGGRGGRGGRGGGGFGGFGGGGGFSGGGGSFGGGGASRRF